MAAADILTRFEVNLTENVVQDILTPGKTFESEVWRQNADQETHAGSSVLLQKLGDSIFKLLVTVYKPTEVTVVKPEQADGFMQTEKKTDGVDTQTDIRATEHSSMQTKGTDVESASMQTDKQSTGVRPTQTDSNAVPTDARLTQTDNAVVEENSMQTDEKKTKVLPTQTDTKVLNESFMQTEEKEFVDSFMQTDIKAFASSDVQTEIMCFERFEQICQASVETKTSDCQTQVECSEQDCQTELEQVDSECQTYKDEQTRDTQTVIKEFVETDIQTDSSMALLVEQDCQASVELFDGECQATVEQAESEAQAVVTMQEGECQASVESCEGECQATVESCEGECQAVVLQAEGMCQATVDMAEGECQAGVEQVDGGSQVELEYSETECQASVEQVDGDCQAYPDGAEIESQTDASFWLLADNESQTEAPEKEEEEGETVQLTPMQSGRSVCMQTEAVRIKTKISQTDGICEDVPVDVEAQQQALKVPPADAPPADAPPADAPPADVPLADVPLADVPLADGPVADIPPLDNAVQAEGQIDPSMISIMNAPGVMQVGLDGQPVGDMPHADMPTIVSIEPVARPEDAQANEATIISIEPVKNEYKGEKGGDCKEMSCQTDPVTIIIGDASFLVNRLKDSSSQPARVSRNEIEIEVGPESDRKDLFNFDSKRNVRRIKTEPGRGVRQQQTPRARIKKEKVSARLPELPAPQDPGPVQRLPPPGSDELGQYSCPFCALTFHESPALYEHLQVDHGNITSSAKTKSPRSGGRGKATTTRARKRPAPGNPPPELQPNDIIEPIDGGDEHGGPPILTPYREGEEYSEEAELAAQREQEERQMKMHLQLEKQRASDAVYDDQPPGEDDGPGLFEDVPEQPKSKKRRQPRELQQRNKSVFPPLAKPTHSSNIELDCPMCAQKFGTPDLLYLHIRRYHKDEDNSRKRIDVVNALMHDKLAETPELLPVPGSRRRRRLPMVATDSTSDSPAKRRRTREVIEEFEESLIEDMAPGPQELVERMRPHEEENLEEPAFEDEVEEEQQVENLVERINPEDEEEDEQEDHMEGEEQIPSDMLENMVEVVVQEPGEEQEEEEEEVEEEMNADELAEEQARAEEEQAAEEETAGLVEAIEPVEDNGVDEDSDEAVEEDIEPESAVQEESEAIQDEPAAGKVNASGLRRTRHSLQGQGPPRSTPRTRGGRRH